MSRRRCTPLRLAALAAVIAAALAAGCASGGRAGRSETGAGATVPLSAASPLLAGAASVVITPTVDPSGPPVRMAGFGPGRDATGVNDDLYARALVLAAGDRAVALVALDLIGFFHDDVVQIRDEVRARHPEVGVDTILVASTHTHAGPDVIGIWTPPERSVDAAYIGRIRSAAADAVAQAWSRRRPARLSFATADRADLIQDSRLPEVIDPTVRLLKVDAADGRETIATLLNFADHPESLGRGNTLLSSDYPGATRRRLEEAFGGVAIFTSADIGGLLTPLGMPAPTDPRTGQPIPEKTVRLMERLGQEVADSAILAWRAAAEAGAAGTMFRGTLLVRSRIIQVPLDNPRFVAGLQAGHIRARALDAQGRLTSEAAVLTLWPSPSSPADDAPVGGGSGGAGVPPLAQFACVPGEIYPELVVGGIQTPQDPGADFQGAPPEPLLGTMLTARYRFILGLCNDELGYIIPRSEWDATAPYAYGRNGPQYGEINSAGPSVAPLLLDTFRDLLR
jgi:Neutral/alkaline non-lysosomal ceramidase, N-terminal